MLISSYCQIIHRALKILLGLLPITIIFYWATYQTSYDFWAQLGLIPFGFDVATNSPLTFYPRLLAIGVTMIYCLILMRALLLLIRLFGNYVINDVFSIENSIIYRKLSYCIFYWVFGGVIYGAVITLILSLNNSAGHHCINMTLSDTNILAIPVAMMILAISRVMEDSQQSKFLAK